MVAGKSEYHPGTADVKLTCHLTVNGKALWRWFERLILSRCCGCDLINSTLHDHAMNNCTMSVKVGET